LTLSLLAVASSVAFFGCGSDAKKLASFAAEANQTNIQKINNAYLLMASRNQFRGPKNEDAFRNFLIDNDNVSSNLEFMGIDRDNVDSYFLGRDDQPFFIRYGLSGLDPSSSAPIVFEAEGIDGVRQVGFSDWSIKSIDNDQEYQRLRNGKN
jgi:hypothetical protein